MKTKTYNPKKNAKWNFVFAGILILTAIILGISNVDNVNIGNIEITSWLYTIGSISLIIGIKNYFYGKEIKYDERTQLLILKSTRGTFSALIYLLLALMLGSFIQPIEVNLMTFSSLLLFFVIIVYKIYYRILNKKY